VCCTYRLGAAGAPYRGVCGGEERICFVVTHTHFRCGGISAHKCALVRSGEAARYTSSLASVHVRTRSTTFVRHIVTTCVMLRVKTTAHCGRAPAPRHVPRPARRRRSSRSAADDDAAARAGAACVAALRHDGAGFDGRCRSACAARAHASRRSGRALSGRARCGRAARGLAATAAGAHAAGSALSCYRRRRRGGCRRCRAAALLHLCDACCCGGAQQRRASASDYHRRALLLRVTRVVVAPPERVRTLLGLHNARVLVEQGRARKHALHRLRVCVAAHTRVSV
jgi:hypothetical protein